MRGRCRREVPCPGHGTARLRAFVQVAMEQVHEAGGPARAVESLWAGEHTGR
jgi:hypothetical protein